MPLFVRVVVKKKKHLLQRAFIAVGLYTVSFLRGVIKTHK